MTSFVFGGGRGGGGFTLGPAQNVFTGADRAAAESARDTYFTANPSNLAQYNADTSLNIILQYTDNGDGVAVYQVRNSAGTAWLDNSSARGVAGRDGMADIPSVPDGTIPMVQGGALVASSMREVSDLIESAKSLGIPDNSLNFLNLRISASQGRFIAYDMFNQVYALIGSRPLTPAGTGTFSIELATARQGPVVFQSRTDTTHTTTELAFNFTNITKAIIDNWVTRGTNGKFYIQIHGGTDANARVIYRSHTPAQIADGDVFDLTGDPGTSDFVLDTSLEPAFQDTGQDLYVRLLSPDATPFTILGSVTTQTDVDADPLGFTVVGQNVPYFGTRFWTIVDERILTEADLPTDEETQDLVAAMFTGGTHNGLTVQYDDTNGVINLNVTGVTPPISPDPGVSGLSSTVPSRVETGTNLNENAQFTFTTQATDQITALNLVVTGGDDKTITVPSSDGTHTVQIALTGIDTSSDGQVTFQIRGTTSGGQTIMSNTLTTQIRTTQPDELAYFAVRPTNDFATVDLAILTSVDVQQPGSSYEISVNFPATEILGILEPADRPITRITEKTLGIPILDTFQRTNSARTINGQLYNLLTQTNNGRTAPIDYEVFHG